MKRLAASLVLTLLLGAGYGLRVSFRSYLHFLPFFFAGPPPERECGDGPGFKYCRYTPPYGVPLDPQAVLYFFHYAKGDERSWGRIPISRVFYAEFRRRGLPAPTVLSISYGAYWTFFDKGGGRVRSPLASDFLNGASPWLERKTGVPKRRYVWGMSQGGLDAALLAFKKPALWSAAVLSCPAFYEIDPFSSKEKVAEYAGSRGLDVGKFAWGLGLVADRAAGPEEWKREDPLARARVALPKALPRFFVDYNAGDEYGFQKGAEAFVGALEKNGGTVTALENPGGHCEIDPWAASAFIAESQAKRD